MRFLEECFVNKRNREDAAVLVHNRDHEARQNSNNLNMRLMLTFWVVLFCGFLFEAILVSGYSLQLRRRRLGPPCACVHDTADWVDRHRTHAAGLSVQGCLQCRESDVGARAHTTFT